MNFFDKSFLQQHCKDILAFYDEGTVDPSGGFFQNFYDNGEIFDAQQKHLVSSCRMVVNYCRAFDVFANKDYLEKARHGLTYIELTHFNPVNQHFAWTVKDHKPQDKTQHAYGYAFVLLAFAWCHKVGLLHESKIEEIFNLTEQRFWQPDHGLYADELSENGVLSDYRGQNANMHLCEALIQAFEATGNNKYLSRALLVAQNITMRQADLTDGLIWEHFTKDFQPDWQYNIDDPKNLYRPWGFQGGHQIEWAKLLMQLYRHKAHPWMLDRACHLFDKAFELSWDSDNGGLVYGFDSANQWCDDDKYFWVQAEALAAAAYLYQTTDNQAYINAYTKLWQYCWQHFVDHQHGAWFRLLSRDNNKYSNEKSLLGAKCDYHNLGACLDISELLS